MLAAAEQLDRIEQRLTRLDARAKAKAAPGQIGLFGGGGGQACGQGHIAPNLTCHKGAGQAAAVEAKAPAPAKPAAAPAVDHSPAASKERAKGGLQFTRGREGRHAAYRYAFRDRDAAEHWLADEAARSGADLDAGPYDRRRKEWQQAYESEYRENRGMYAGFDDRQLLDYTSAMAESGKATSGGTVVDVRIGGNKHSRPVAAAKGGPAKELTAFTAVTAKQQADLARQQQAAAAAAGDKQGELAWKKEERTVERLRVEAALNAAQQVQQGLFGVTEYDETMPLFRRDGDPTTALLSEILGEQLEGATVLDWQVARPGVHAGRLEAEGLIYRFRTDGAEVAYRPAWEGLDEQEWEARSEGFLQARDPNARVDFRKVRFEQKTSKRKCSIGYSCGRTCIVMSKECRVTPGTAIGKQRLRALQALAKEGGPQFERLAAEVSAGRHAKATQLKEERQVGQLKKLLKDPRVAEMVRTGKVPEAAPAKKGKVRDVSPADIEVDAARFQYKIGASSTGEVGSLSGVKKWDPNLAGVISVWEDPEDGKTYVINGHNRLALARRMGAEEVTVRYLDAPDAKHARAIGAMQNIAEGQGTAIDAAKFFRDTGIKDLEGVQAAGLPLKSGKAGQGLALQALPDGLFQAVVQGDLSINRGAIIGGSGLSPEKQAEVFKVVKANDRMTDSTLQEYVDAAAVSERQSQGTLDVFGTEQQQDNLLERSQLAAGLKSKLSREKRLFGLVSKTKAAEQLQSKAGNQINVSESAAVSQEAAQVLSVFNSLKNTTGPVSAALNAAANRVKAGESAARVKAELEEAVMRGVEEELRRLGLASKPKNTNEELGSSLFDSAAARLDAIEARLQRLDDQGQPCGRGHIAPNLTCHQGRGPGEPKAPVTERLPEQVKGRSGFNDGRERVSWGKVSLDEPVKLGPFSYKSQGETHTYYDTAAEASYRVTLQDKSRHPHGKDLQQQVGAAIGADLSSSSVFDAEFTTALGSRTANYSRDPDMPPAAAKLLARAIRVELEGAINELPDNTIVTCNPWREDGLGDKRTRIYERAGFRGFGEHGGMVAMVQAGRLVKLPAIGAGRGDSADEIDLESLVLELLEVGGGHSTLDSLEARLVAISG